MCFKFTIPYCVPTTALCMCFRTFWTFVIINVPYIVII